MESLSTQSMLKLLQITSPSLPVGAFSYSQGLEWAVEVGWVHDRRTFEIWVSEQLHGTQTCQELPLLQRFYTAFSAGDLERIQFLTATVLSLRETSELRAEERNRGYAMSRLTERLRAVASEKQTYPADVQPDTTNGAGTCSVQCSVHDSVHDSVHGSVECAAKCMIQESGQSVDQDVDHSRVADASCCGAGTTGGSLTPGLAGSVGGREELCQLGVFAEFCARECIPVGKAMLGYAFTWLESQVMAGVKLVPLGQTDGQLILYRLSESIAPCVQAAMMIEDDDIGYSSPALALASCLHETQYSRLFRS